MKSEDLARAYEAFFIKSDAGGHFMNEINRLISDHHKDAEQEPELSRDHVQRACGTREVISHIESVMTTVKKGRL